MNHLGVQNSNSTLAHFISRPRLSLAFSFSLDGCMRTRSFVRFLSLSLSLFLDLPICMHACTCPRTYYISPNYLSTNLAAALHRASLHSLWKQYFTSICTYVSARTTLTHFLRTDVRTYGRRYRISLGKEDGASGGFSCLKCPVHLLANLLASCLPFFSFG